MVYALLALALVGVWLFCLFDVLSTDEGDVRHLPKFGWFLIVLLGALPGAALWLILGRPRRPLAVGMSGAWPGADSRPDAPKGPDDDPAFLRELDRRLRGEDGRA
ncbi:membrane protein [Actinomadura rubrobrunea]|uniref:Membrane protein n=1 Tax=Actinomadura rubrobrunea TaxID=115335 RepID=A0A9W6PZF6_9ACTN|nr:PLDc N-terminal domain-containing protein [Actinomadura rubrobrunea]GLW65844.1 membrane protein [Actinomadura rubrobrunea]